MVIQVGLYGRYRAGRSLLGIEFVKGFFYVIAARLVEPVVGNILSGNRPTRYIVGPGYLL